MKSGMYILLEIFSVGLFHEILIKSKLFLYLNLITIFHGLYHGTVWLKIWKGASHGILELMRLVHALALHKHNLIQFADKELRGKHDGEHHEGPRDQLVINARSNI